MPGDLLESGLIGGVIVALVSGVVQVWLWRIRGRTAERLKGLDLTSTRDSRALEAESQAFGYMQKALEDARKEVDARESDIRRLEGDLRRALEDSVNSRTLGQSLLFKVEARSRQAEQRVREARFLLVQLDQVAREQRDELMHLARVSLSPLPQLPRWVRDEDGPKRLTGGAAEDDG